MQFGTVKKRTKNLSSRENQIGRITTRRVQKTSFTKL